MDPDLLAEYAKAGASGRDSQWVDGPSIDLVLKYRGKTSEVHHALYKDGATHWTEDIDEIDLIERVDIRGYISVAFFEVTIKTIMADGKEAVLFTTDHAERGKRYETSTEIDGEKAFLSVTIGK